MQPEKGKTGTEKIHNWSECNTYPKQSRYPCRIQTASSMKIKSPPWHGHKEDRDPPKKSALLLCSALNRNGTTPYKPLKGKALSISPKRQITALLTALQWHSRMLLPCCCRAHKQQQKYFCTNLYTTNHLSWLEEGYSVKGLADNYQLFLSLGHLRDFPSSGALFYLSFWCLFRGKQASNEPALPPIGSKPFSLGE